MKGKRAGINWLHGIECQGVIVPDLLSACDLYVKATAVSSMEALLRGRALFDSLQDCGHAIKGKVSE